MIQFPLRILPFLFILLLPSLSLFAQVNKSTITGNVYDETDLPIPGATIMVLEVADSTLVQFGSSDNQGSFMIKNVAKGDYLLNIIFLGMEPLYLPITSGITELVNLDTIQLLPKTNILSEVQVKAEHMPIEMTKDTINYNADAFQTQPNAVVEDLLKKLPGIEVAADGSIKAQGEDVKNVFVDGKEFFGSDPKMATKNLPANAIKKVKVYDRQSDMSEFTGIDDGERSKTIDLVLRDNFKQGLFGNGEAGYGSDERYNLKASINRFSKKSQLSFLGQLNNINQQGFSFTDRMSFSGGAAGMRGGGGFSSDGLTSEGTGNGLINTGAAGLNFNWQKSKKFNIRSSYFYNNVQKNLEQYSYRQNIADNPFDTTEDSDNDTKNTAHNIALNSDIKPDSTQQVKVNVRLGFGDGSSTNESFIQNILPDSTLENQSQNDQNNSSDNLTLNANATYIKRLGDKGRNMSIGGTVTSGNQDDDSILDAITEYYSTGRTDILDQLQYTTNDDLGLEARFSYTEPLKKRRFLELNYIYNTTNTDYNHQVNDVENAIEVPNDTLSNYYSSTFQYHRPGATFQYSGEINTFSAGLQYQLSDLTGELSRSEDDIKQTYHHLLPRVTWRSNIGNGKSLRFTYTTRVNAPSIIQLSPVLDNSDPLRLYIGNPNLNAEYNHRLNLMMHAFSQFSSTSLFATIGATFTNNKIITSRYINEQFRQISTPINITNENGANMYVSYGRPFKPIHSRFTVNVSLNYTNTQNVVGTDLLDLNIWARTGGITISNMNSSVLEYNLGGSWTFSNNYYNSDEATDQNTVLQNYFIDFTLTLWKKWRLNAGYDYKVYSSDQFSDNQTLPLMKMSVSRFILPGDKGQLKFSIFDVLDENRGLSLTANANYIEEITSNSIGRYGMLSFIYSLRGAVADQGGSMKVREMHK